MIARITGTLLELDSKANSILLEVGDICYEIMVPGYCVSDLSSMINHGITLHCLEHLEGTAGGNSFVPRIIGFPQSSDKAFFQRFISVKGIGIRKALRALAKPLADIASSIENSDAKMLKTLPEIGKRTAELLIAELKGKMGDYAVMSTGLAGGKPHREQTEVERQAIEILVQLGEKNAEALELIERVLNVSPDIESTDELVQAVYKLKSGAL